MSTHALFPPSATPRWKTCTGSFGLGLQIPEPPSGEYAVEGERLHELAARALVTHVDKRPADEDHAAIEPYIEHVDNLIASCGEDDTYAIEKTLRYSDFLSGTPDFQAWIDRTLEVVDLKTGAGIMVDPVENEQLLTYAFLVLADQFATHRTEDGKVAIKLTAKQLRNFLHAEGWDWPERITLTIVQPTDEKNPVKSWETTTQRVLDHGVEIEAAIAIALSGNGQLVPGTHCRFCKAKSICPKLRGEVVEALEGALPATMPVTTLATWLDRCDRMEQFIKDVRETGHDVASRAVAAGVEGIPGWTLKPKRATRSWADEDAVLAFARARKIKIYQDKLLSPAMAEKQHPNLPKELRDQIVAVSSGMNLVRLKAGEAPMHMVKVPDDASKKERLQANIALMKFRR